MPESSLKQTLLFANPTFMTSTNMFLLSESVDVLLSTKIFK